MISVFTAVHPPAIKFLSEAYVSLLKQTYSDWEWVISPNGGAEIPPAILQDKKVVVVECAGGQAFAKATACHYSKGSVIVKLDADDLLAPTTLETLVDTEGFAYGNFATFKDGTWHPYSYARRGGWKHRTTYYDRHRAIEHLSWPPGPLMFASLMYAPHCIVAWNREAYRRTGGYDRESFISPEHELQCKTYLELGDKKIVLHDKCLGFYRIHDANTSSIATGPLIEKREATYYSYVEQLFEKWSKDFGFEVCSIDERWNKDPIADNCLGLARIHNMLPPWDELFRVMVSGGLVSVGGISDATDPRFQLFKKSASGTHFICLKPPYSNRPIGCPEIKI